MQVQPSLLDRLTRLDKDGPTGFDQAIKGVLEGTLSHGDIVLFRVQNRTSVAPSGNPSRGDVCFVARGATREWAGHEGTIAVFSSAWEFLIPQQGWRLRVDDEDCDFTYIGSEWEVSKKYETSLTERQFCERLRRDLGWLLNSRALPNQDELAECYPLVAASAMNYGMSSISGDVAALAPLRVCAMVRTAIERFEPRISRKTLVVRALRNTPEQETEPCVIRLEIECDVMMIPHRLVLSTNLNTATGICDVQEKGYA